MATENKTGRKLRIGILSFAHMHARSYAAELLEREDVVISGVWDEDVDRGKDAAQSCGCEFHADLDPMLSTPLDGIVVASENIHHLPLVKLCANAGIQSILCEKPLATTSHDALSMLQACRSAGSKLFTALPCRHSAPFQRLLKQVRGGEIGDVLAIRGTNHGTMPGGWFVEPELSGGGAIMDHTPHVADLFWLLLQRDPMSVYAESGSGFHHLDCEDTGFLTIRYPDGVFATLDTSWSRPASFPTWGDVTLQVVGTGGVIDADLFAQSVNVYSDETGRASWEYWGSGIDKALIDDFLLACAGDEPAAIATGEDGLRAVTLAEAAYTSIKAREPAAVSAIAL